MLTVTRRTGRNDALTISGYVKLNDGTRKRIQQRANTNDWAEAEMEAAALASKYHREMLFGPAKGSRLLSEAIISYLDAEDRSAGTKGRLRRIIAALQDDDPSLGAVDQDIV